MKRNHLFWGSRDDYPPDSTKAVVSQSAALEYAVHSHEGIGEEVLTDV
jgi:hypothetical protein